MTHFNFDDQIASEPQAVKEVIDRVKVPELDPERPLVFTGIGTSLHACRIAAAWVADLSAGMLRPVAVEAHEFGLRGAIGPEDQIIVVSHRGTKIYPNKVLARAKEVGAATIMVTGFGVEHPMGDWVLRTCPDETAGTHSVSYVTALTTLGLLVATLVGKRGQELRSALEDVPEAMKRTLAFTVPSDVVEKLANKNHILLTGFGLDEITAEEAALKIKEGAYLWAEGMSVELALHGTPAVFESGMGAIILMPAEEDDGGRSTVLRNLLGEIGVHTFTCGSGEDDLRCIEVNPLVRPLVSIIPLQRLVAEMARIRGTNPDRIHMDVEPWASAIKHVKL